MDILLTAFITFAATNIDDIFVLMLLFSQVGKSYKLPQIIIGQYLGFMALILISLLGFLVSFVISQKWLGILGLVPIFIGIRKLVNLNKRDEQTAISAEIKHPSSLPLLEHFLSPQTYSVMAITFANGGDNIGIYTPLFANSSLLNLIIIICLFLVFMAIWCLAAYRFTRHPGLADVLSKYGQIIVPFVFIVLGLYIIINNKTLTLLGL